MRAIAVFESCRDRRKQIKALEDAIAALVDGVTSCAGGIGETVKSALGDRYSAYLARKESLEAELKLLKHKWAAEQVAVILLTDKMPEQRRDAARLFYGRGRNIDQIAITLNYSIRQIERILEDFRKCAMEISCAQVDGVLPGWYLEMEKRRDGGNGAAMEDIPDALRRR